jgi:hypothetical protein
MPRDLTEQRGRGECSPLPPASMALRVARITLFSVALLGLFELSRRVGAAMGNEEVPGLLAAVGALALLFTVRAVATESAMGPEANRQKDFLWGLSLGCWGTILLRLLGSQLA